MIEQLLQGEQIRAFQEAMREGDSLLTEELWNSSKALITAIAQQATGKHILMLTGANAEESKLFHDFPFWTKNPLIEFPAWETLPSESLAPSPDIVGERYQALRSLLTDKRPHLILSNLQACLQKLVSPEKFSTSYLELKKGTMISFDALTSQLEAMGYQRRSIASDKGEFAIRGGIIDVFPVSSPDPYRLEFWGDEIESIRIYDPIGQRTVRSVDHLEMTLAQELELIGREEKLSTILDYLGPNTIVVFDDLYTLEERYAALMSVLGKPTRSFCSLDQFLDQAQTLQKLYLTNQSIEELSEVHVLDKHPKNFYSAKAPLYPISFHMFNRKLTARRWQNSFVPLDQYLISDQELESSPDELLRALSRLNVSDMAIFLLSTSEIEENQFRKRIFENQFQIKPQAHFTHGYLSSGLVDLDAKVLVFPYTELTQRYKIRRQKQRSTYHSLPTEAFDLAPGDTVVHLNNGIGRFLGLEKRPNHLGVESEFFTVEYADQAKLYVPLNQAHLISKYIGSTDEVPQLHTIGSARWKRTREQTERAILSYASELLQLYAKRSVHQGFVYSADSEEMKIFEETFPFVETEDQLQAVQAIKEDMLSTKMMDRLVCGDVGYGKTEVAMRAAFKAVVDGNKQVAVLVPTTVLAMQHFENFCERMSNFAINIGVLSRFRTPKQIKQTLEGVANGSIDILVGTHRIIGSDVVFKDLGLIIIDEEQRFGVKAKEHLKTIKTGVDCLTLSATPIPRTLYMSLIGARDMSVINTPPQDRLPISTFIAEYNEQTIKTALLRELARDGQAYFIHNRVESIFQVADRLKKLLPQARVVCVHGQMSSDEIDQVFHTFKKGQADILVATTIIESGIDIPNANTILIDRADRFGLADLYQMRGRVGRWNRRAYAYFLVPSQRSLPEISRKRLNALAEASGYGGGMKIAMRDLSIRGAGNVLGWEQSGHVSAIGFHLYCKLLKRTLQALQGKIPAIISDTKLEFPQIDARLPESYIDNATLRMEIYQRLGEAIRLEEVNEILDELKDRFGTPPPAVLWLYHLTRLRVYAATHGFILLRQEKLSLTMEKKQGSQTQMKKILIKPFQTPQDMEDKLLKAMQEFR